MFWIHIYNRSSRKGLLDSLKLLDYVKKRLLDDYVVNFLIIYIFATDFMTVKNKGKQS
jgi:hypothetical protein